MKTIQNITDKNAIKTAVDLWKQGELVAFATETVYGLGGDATNDDAVSKIYKTKKRSPNNPLIVHCGYKSQLKQLVKITKIAKLTINEFLPASLTLILKKRKNAKISKMVNQNTSRLAIRIPSHSGALKLLQAVNRPIAAPSANLSGKISPTTPFHVKADFNDKVKLIMDGGNCEKGIESTILDISMEEYPYPIILRAGTITKKMLEDKLKVKIYYIKDINKPPSQKSSHIKLAHIKLAPGLEKSHYCPNLKLEINITNPDVDAAFIGFGDKYKNATLNLSVKGNLAEAASNLFNFLHILDDKNKYSKIQIAPIPNNGIGIAINDRITRASV